MHRSIMRAFQLPARLLLAAGICFALVGRVLADTPIKPDSGKFTVILQENEVAVETFKITADGSEYDQKLSLAGQTVNLHNSTKIKNGVLTELTSGVGEGNKFLLTVAGDKSKIKIGEMAAKDVKLPARLYPADPLTPHFFAYLVAAYDAKKGGTQKFDTVNTRSLGPNGVPIQMAFKLTAAETKARQIAGKTVQVSHYTLAAGSPIGDVDSDLYTDAEGRVLYWIMATQKLYAVRAGYEELAKPETPADPTLSQPTYKVKIEQKVMVAMRDGVKLAAEVYRPDAPGAFPVILQRTCYGRENAQEASSYAKRGYVFVAQDVRGRGDSAGEFHPLVFEPKDGYDSVEWCAGQPWSNGNVGMIGASYLGYVQWAAAREGNKHLKCLIPIVSPTDAMFNFPYAHGAFLLLSDLWWTNAVRGKTLNIEAPDKMLNNLELMKTLPVTDIDKKVFGTHIPFFQEWLRHSSNDAYWQQVSFTDRTKEIGPIPVLHVSGWFDGDGIGTKLNYAAMTKAGYPNQKLIYGPWTHALNTSTKIGTTDFGPESLRDLDTLYLRWFDHWLKGVDNGIDREPPVEVFLMGENKWRSFSAWPPKEAQMTRWYFHSKGHANAEKSDGTLSTGAPASVESTDRYTYDPTKPFIPLALLRPKEAGQGLDAAWMDPKNPDPNVLTYTSDALAQDQVVAGPISVHLAAATSAKDTDWFTVLEDVGPDGKGITLVRGILRARFHSSFEKPTLLTPGAIGEYTIDLWTVGNVFKKGHRIRVYLTSSCFPLYDRNLNTGADNETTTATIVAKQTIYHNAAHPSYLVLPTLPK